MLCSHIAHLHFHFRSICNVLLQLFLKKMPPFNSYIYLAIPPSFFSACRYGGVSYSGLIVATAAANANLPLITTYVRKKKCARSNVSGQCIGSYSSTLRFRSFPFQCVFLLFHLNVGLRVALICVMISLHAAAVSPSCYHHKGT